MTPKEFRCKSVEAVTGRIDLVRDTRCDFRIFSPSISKFNFLFWSKINGTKTGNLL
jgi:hypothetical protein